MSENILQDQVVNLEPRLVSLTNSDEYALVDEQDYRKVMQYEWQSVGSQNYKYAATRLNTGEALTFLIRFIYGDHHPNLCLSYINKNRLDCTRKNIEVSNQNLIKYDLTNITQNDVEEVQSHFLRSSSNESGYIGVSFCKKSKSWKAKTKTGAKKDETLGYFKTKEMAALAYYRATRESLFIHDKTNERWWKCH